LTETPGYYTTGDAGVLDERGYLHIMTRVDDVINTCGHRISTGRLEEAVNEHSLVVESAVVGYDEDLRGECPLAYVILRGKGVEGMDINEVNKISSSINDQIRKDVGAFCRLIGVIFVEKLPKTRSGKILRGTIRKICNDNPYAMPATIDDPAVLDQIKVATAEWKKTLK
jgi:propionyl-CoA synthetase